MTDLSEVGRVATAPIAINVRDALDTLSALACKLMTIEGACESIAGSAAVDLNDNETGKLIYHAAQRGEDLAEHARADVERLHQMISDARPAAGHASHETLWGMVDGPATPATAAQGPADSEDDTKDVDTILHGVFCEIYALDDLTRRYPQSALSHITMREAAHALAEEVRANLGKCGRILGEGHAALPHFAQADQALEAIEDLMIGVAAADDISVSAETLSDALLGFVVRAGAAIDHARGACGLRQQSGYIDYGASLDPAGRPDSDSREEAAHD